MNRQALVVGINRYPWLKDGSGQSLNLIKPATDAEAIAQILETYGNFQVNRFPVITIDESPQIDVGFGSSATEAGALKEAISNLFNPEKNIPDTALLFFAGTGLQEEKGGVKETFLAVGDTNPQIGKWGLSLRWLYQLLQQSPIKQQIVWLDCFYGQTLLDLCLETNSSFHGINRDRCFLVSTEKPGIEIEEISEEHSFFTNSLLEALATENHPNRCVTNYALVDYINKQFANLSLHFASPQIRREEPIFHNSGSEIILTRETEIVDSTAIMTGVCPYKGLGAFEFNQIDPKYFYGRTALTNLLLEKVRASNFLAVVGGSGSGKSSVVKAGLLHQLKLGQRISGSNNWPIIIFRPGEHPLKSLAVAIADYRGQVATVSETIETQPPLSDARQGRSLASSSYRAEGASLDLASPKVKPPPPLHLHPKAMSNKKRSPQKSLPTPPPPPQREIRERGKTRDIPDIPESWEMGRSPTILEPEESNGKAMPTELTSPSNTLQPSFPIPGAIFQQDGENQRGLENGFAKTEKPQPPNYAFVEEILNTQGSIGLRELLQIPGTPPRGKSSSRVVLVVDRLEEVFTLCQDDRERQQFIECLMGVLEPWVFSASLSWSDFPDGDENLTRSHSSASPTYTSVLVIVTMRAEFFGKCVNLSCLGGKSRPEGDREYAELARQIQSQLVTVTPMNRSELEQVIIEPAKQVGIEVQPELVEELIADIESLGNLSLLQYALTEMWRQRRSDRSILSDYRRLGGIKGCLEKRASQVYQSFTEKERQIARDILLELISIGEIETEDTLRQMWKTDLVTQERSLPVISKVLQRLAKARLIVTSKQRVSPESNKTATVVELAHESAIRHWSKLHSWVESRRDALRRARKLEADAIEWQNKRKPRENLLVGLKLSETEMAIASTTDPISLSPLAQELVKKSTQQKRLRHFCYYSIFAGAMLAVLGLFGWTVSNWQQAELQREQVESEKLNAQLDAMSLSSQKLLADSKNFDALIEALKAGKLLFLARGPGNTTAAQLAGPSGVDFSGNTGKSPVAADTQIRVVTSLLQAVYGVRKRRTLAEHALAVNSVSISADGSAIASASDDGTVKLWTSYGEKLATIRGHQGAVNSVIFSPDGKIIASAGDDGTIKLSNSNGRERATLREHRGAVNSISFSGTGEAIASAGTDGTIKLWNKNGLPIGSFRAHQKEIYSVSIGPDSQIIASASEDKTVKIWRVDFSPANSGKFSQEEIEPEEIATLRGHRDRVSSVSISPDGKTIASASWDRTIKIWNANGEEIGTLRGHNSPAIAIAFSPDGKTIASASADGIIKLWTSYGREIATLKGHSGAIASLSFSPDGLALASASADNTIKLWSVGEQKIPALIGHNQAIAAVSFSPTGEAIATASLDNTIKIWSPEGEEVRTLAGHNQRVNSVSFSPHGTVIASASADGTIELWNIDDGSNLTLRGHLGGVNSVSFSPDGKTIVSGGADKSVKLWNLKGRELMTFTGHEHEVRSVSFSADGRSIVSADDGDGSDNIKLWSVDGFAVASFSEVCLAVNRVNFSPDGETIAAACSDNVVKLLARDGKAIATLKGHKNEVTSVSFRPDGEIVASASADGTIKIWTRDGEELASLTGHGDRVLDLSFSPDGKMLVSGSRDFTALLWHLDLEYLLARGCDFAADYLQKSPNLQESDRTLCDDI